MRDTPASAPDTPPRAASLRGGTIGAFDLLHVGHLRFLAACRRHCDYLQVGIGADTTILRSKKRLPVIDERQRREMVAGLRSVDETVLFEVGLDNTEASAAWIAAWGVGILFVSEEWQPTPRWQRLAPALEARGIRLMWLPYSPEVSTTAIRRRIVEREEPGRP